MLTTVYISYIILIFFLFPGGLTAVMFTDTAQSIIIVIGAFVVMGLSTYIIILNFVIRENVSYRSCEYEIFRSAFGSLVILDVVCRYSRYSCYI